MAIEKFRFKNLLLDTAGETVDTSDGVRIMDGESSYDGDVVEHNDDRPFFGGKSFDFTNQRASVTGSANLTVPAMPGASGSDGETPYTKLLVAAGMSRETQASSSTITYTPADDDIDAVDIKWEHAGTLLDVRNCLATMQIKLEIGQQPMLTGIRIQGSPQPMSLQETNRSVNLGAFVRFGVCRDDNSEMQITVHLASGDVVCTVPGKMLMIDTACQIETDEYTGREITDLADRTPTFTVRFGIDNDAFPYIPEELRNDSVRITARMRQYERAGALGRYVEQFASGLIEGVSKVEVRGKANYELTCRAVPTAAGNEWGLRFGESFRITVTGGPSFSGTQNSALTAIDYNTAGTSTGTITWSIHSGALPAGVTLNTSTGVVSGTPTAAGTFNFVVKAVDSRAGTARSALTAQQTLVIAAA